MNRWIGIVGACVFSSLVFAQPKMMSPEAIYDFGMRGMNGKVEHDFLIQNMGDEVLHIQKVSSSCGCTVAKLEQTEILPGESTTVRATFDLKGRSGTQEKTITVYCNDPQQPQFLLFLKGEVFKAFSVTPAGLFWGRIGDDPIPEKEVTIAALTPFEITGIRTAESHMEAKVVGEAKLDKEGRTVYVIQTHLVPPYPDGRFAGDLEIGTTLADSPIINIPFAAYYMP